MVKENQNQTRLLKGKNSIRAFMCDVPRPTLEIFIGMGLPIIKIGGQYWSHKDAIERWFAEYLCRKCEMVQR